MRAGAVKVRAVARHPFVPKGAPHHPNAAACGFADPAASPTNTPRHDQDWISARTFPNTEMTMVISTAAIPMTTSNSAFVNPRRMR